MYNINPKCIFHKLKIKILIYKGALCWLVLYKNPVLALLKLNIEYYIQIYCNALKYGLGVWVCNMNMTNNVLGRRQTS
jgi:hypothetical protein